MLSSTRTSTAEPGKNNKRSHIQNNEHDKSMTMASETPLWEGLKENAAPLQRGRSVAALERSLAVDMTETFRLQVERTIEHYERKVRPSEAADAAQTMDAKENPLQYWIEYIKYHQENFPSNTREQKLLLERCVRALSRFPKYANNVTFVVSICCNYASNTDQPAEIFKFMFQSNIGTQVAKFYAAWAYVAEKQEDFEEAKKIFELGIRKKAQPMNYLLGRQSHFHRRMARHWINSTAIVDDMEDSSSGARGALGGLSEEAFRKNDRGAAVVRPYQRGRAPNHHRQQHHSSSSSSASQATFVDRTAIRREAPRSNVVNSGGAFAIFVDENENNAPPPLLDDNTSFVANPDRQLEREEDRRKENTRDVERWNASGGYAPMYDAVPQPPPARRARTTKPFAVHVDEELAAQHEEEAKQEEARVEHMRRHRDERTFRQRDGQGVEDKLARDPLRYVRNPGKLDEDKRRAEKEENKRRGREKDARMAKLLKNNFGEEQCFHEARASAHYYKLAPTAWNINRFITGPSSLDESDMSVDESADDVSMTDRQSPAKKNISFSQKMPAQRPPPLSARSLFSRNDSLHSYTDPTPRNTSTASSTVDEAAAVGAVGEPTINTQLAIKELSMMFSSPAMGLNESLTRPERHGGLGPILNESGVSEAAGADAMASIDEAQEEDDIMEANDLAVDSSLFIGPENNQSPTNPHARTTDSPNFDGMALRTLHEDQGGSSSVGCSSQGSRHSVGELSQHDPFRTLGDVELNDQPGFQIYQDEERDQSDDRYPLIAKRNDPPHAVASQPAFKIFQDTGGGLAEDGAALQTMAHVQRMVEHDEDGETTERQDANKSAFDILDEELAAMSQIVDELDAAAEVQGTERGRAAFHVSVSGVKRLHSDTDSEPPAFGDISRIHQIQECTESIGPALMALSEMAIDYPSNHKKDVTSAMARLKEQSCTFPPNRRSLFKILQSGDFVCDIPSHKLQEHLRLPKQGGAPVAPGTEIRFGKSSVMVRRELGRGSYGRVALLDPDPSCQHQLVALKAQSPTNCLAWEYEILKKVQDRIGPQYRRGFPYSIPLSYISLFDGALLAMTAANSSGFNLVDLANVYRSPQLNRSIPEVVVMHYAAIMLLRVEEVHWHGKILHCDVKPDNWALCSSIIDSETVPASDLQLIDFGRAVDLTSHQIDGKHVMETKFTGKATTNDMMCVAMREGLPWSFDIDTFGICASVHILLFGHHIEIAKDKGRWMPKERLRRYHNKIWHEFFYILLNLKDGVALGSHPLSLRRLREQFERELEGKEAKLASELKVQARFLPSAPPRAY